MKDKDKDVYFTFRVKEDPSNANNYVLYLTNW